MHNFFRAYAEGHGVTGRRLVCWASRVVGGSSLHLDSLNHDIADARSSMACANWSRGIDMQSATLGMALPFISFGLQAVDVMT